MSKKGYLDLPTKELLAAFASGPAVPGSGSAVALTAALSASLIEVLATLTHTKASSGTEIQKKNYGPFRARAGEIAALAKINSERLQHLAQEDAVRFAATIENRQLRDAASDPGRAEEAQRVAQLGLKYAAECPIEVAEICLELAALGVELISNGFKSAAGDAGVATHLALAAAEGAAAVTAINVRDVKTDDEWCHETAMKTIAMLDRIPALRAKSNEKPMLWLTKQLQGNL